MHRDSWKIGERLGAARRLAGKTLRELHDLTIAYDPEGRGVLPAQISRIENNTAVCDVRELILLTNALNEKIEAFLTTEVPWFVVRRQAADRRLLEVVERKRVIDRQDKAHDHMIVESGVYKYTPLVDEPDLVQDGESDGTRRFQHLMQKYLFRVGRCDEGDMEKGLDNHDGEEVVWVLEGELEFWAKQPSDGKVTRTVLKPGDCLHYSSRLLHGYRATGSLDHALALFVFTKAVVIPTDEILTKPAVE